MHSLPQRVYVMIIQGCSLPKSYFTTREITFDSNLTDKIKFKIDTGAQVNVITAIVCDKLTNPPPLNKA